MTAVGKVSLYLSEKLANRVRALSIPMPPICQQAPQQKTREEELASSSRIVIDRQYPGGKGYKQAFHGTWLVEPSHDSRVRHADDGFAGACYGVALTRRGQIALYLYHINGRWSPRLHVYDSLESAVAEGMLPSKIAADAAAALGSDREIEIDI